MSVIGSNILAGASSQGGYTIEESLRFNSSQSSYLSWTPATAGDRTTWTWSGWVKRGNLGVRQSIFGAAEASSNNDILEFNVVGLSVGHSVERNLFFQQRQQMT